MNTTAGLMESVKGILEKRGRKAVETAEHEVLNKFNDGAIFEALKYFMQVTLQGTLPVFPALISLSCEIAGGKTEKTVTIGAATMLMAVAADLHDDIIDQSVEKYSNLTVFGKFGRDIALLAGDKLLFQGLMLLHKECESLPREQGKSILNLTSHAFFEISQAEAMETGLWKRLDLSPQEYFMLIKKKTVVHEVHSKIGAILGGGDSRIVEKLGEYGRTFGIVSSIREEFIDLMESQELKNRVMNECPPLPMLFALQNSKIKAEILPILQSREFTEKNILRIIQTVSSTIEAQKLKNEMGLMVQKGVKSLTFIKRPALKLEASNLLKAMLDKL